MQVVEPWGANEPGGQQTAAPAYEEVPLGQELHAVAPDSEKVPGAQIKHAPVEFR